jgi:hypothetical protein
VPSSGIVEGRFSLFFFPKSFPKTDLRVDFLLLGLSAVAFDETVAVEIRTWLGCGVEGADGTAGGGAGGAYEGCGAGSESDSTLLVSVGASFSSPADKL